MSCLRHRVTGLTDSTWGPIARHSGRTRPLVSVLSSRS